MTHPIVEPTHLVGAVHQPAEDYAATAAATTVAYPAASNQPMVQSFEQPAAGQPLVIVQAAPTQNTGPSDTGMSAVMSKLLLGAGVGAGAVIAFAIAGPLLLATIQALAMTAVAIGGCAVALAVAAAMVMKSFRGDSGASQAGATKKRGRRR